MRDYGLDEIDLLTNNPNSLVMFYADWCPYCSRFKPVFEETVKKTDSRILFGGVKLNDDNNPLWDRYGITAVPTLIRFSNKSIKGRRDARMGVGLTRDDLNSILSDIDKDVNNA